jgi:hypothetical protein
MIDATPFHTKYVVVYCVDDQDFEGYIHALQDKDLILDTPDSFILIPLDRITHIEMPKWTGSTFKKTQQGLPII